MSASTIVSQKGGLRSTASERSITPPELPPSLVARRNLVARLREDDAAIVSVIAPAGYGKTTVVAQWAQNDPRPFRWLTLDSRDTDPDVLLHHLAFALHTVEPDDGRGAPRTNAELAHELSTRLDDGLISLSEPFVLVLDDVHLVRRPDSVALLGALIRTLAPGSQLVLVGRSDAALPLSRALASGRVSQIGATDLAMTTSECATVLRAAGIEDAADVGALIGGRTEGWPAGLFLAALALRDQPDPVAAAECFAGNDRIVVDYFEEEVLGHLSDTHVDFLLRASVLDILSGPLCDAVLECTKSDGVLEELARSNTFVVPLDREGELYRLHGLFRDALQSILLHRDRALVRDLHRRASAWLSERGLFDAAVHQSHGAGDDSEIARLAWLGAASHLATGRSAAVGRWLELFTAAEIGAQPPLALTAAWWSLTTGQIGELEHWLREAERAEPDAVLPDGTPIRSATLLLHALIGRGGPAQVRADAAVAFQLDRLDSPFRCVARYLEGSALRLLGDPTGSRQRLEDALALATIAVPATQVQSLDQLALLAIDEEDWISAEDLSRSAIRVVDQHDLRERPAMAIHFAVEALLAARRPDPAAARRSHDHTVALLAKGSNAPPWFMAEAQLLLARAALLSGELATARTLISETQHFVNKCHGADMLHEQLIDATRMVEGSSTAATTGVAPLTPAEIRVLHHLPTQLTFGELGEQLFVSRNTIKTQVHSVYRKLGVSSRTRAVERAREIGLLDR
jgi:LuxR family transcriptional regulator, maltose regulon positive regulatory protein